MGRPKGYQVSEESKRKSRETNLAYSERVKQALEVFPHMEKMLSELEQLHIRNQELELEVSRLKRVDETANRLAEEIFQLEQKLRNCTCL